MVTVSFLTKAPELTTVLMQTYVVRICHKHWLIRFTPRSHKLFHTPSLPFGFEEKTISCGSNKIKHDWVTLSYNHVLVLSFATKRRSYKTKIFQQTHHTRKTRHYIDKTESFTDTNGKVNPQTLRDTRNEQFRPLDG